MAPRCGAGHDAARTDRQLLGSSFGTAAAAYAEHRPDYAPDGVRWALEDAPGPRVLDIGAGTGKLTAMLVEPSGDTEGRGHARGR